VTIVGNSYPAIEHPQFEDDLSEFDSTLYGRQCKQGYQSHFALGTFFLKKKSYFLSFHSDT